MVTGDFLMVSTADSEPETGFVGLLRLLVHYFLLRSAVRILYLDIIVSNTISFSAAKLDSSVTRKPLAMRDPPSKVIEPEIPRQTNTC